MPMAPSPDPPHHEHDHDHDHGSHLSNLSDDEHSGTLSVERDYTGMFEGPEKYVSVQRSYSHEASITTPFALTPI